MLNGRNADVATPLTLGSLARKRWGWRDREMGDTLEVSSTSVRSTALTMVVQEEPKSEG